jgi:O-antigen/teichoic acid export membrane protein
MTAGGRGMSRPRADSTSLAGMASWALGWSFINNMTARLGTLAIGVILARLLGPHSFGTFAVALVAMLAVLSFNELGVSLAIVRWQGDPADIAPTVATISVLSSVIIYVGCFFGAPAFASALSAPAATGVIRILAINVVIDGIVATPAALIQRYFRQDRKMIADQVNSWLGAAVSVGLAWNGLGAVSLAIGRISGAAAAGVLFVIFSPQPLRFGFDRAKARALFRFGMPLAGASIVVFAVTNVDQLVVGRLLGTTALGFYALALNLASWPVNMFSLPVRSVAPAVFSRLQHDRTAMRSGFLSAAGMLGSATLPVCLFISGSAMPLLGFVYGPRWVPAADALMWLAVLSGLRILYELVYDFFVVLARSRVVFTVQLVWLLALVPALIAGARAGGISGAGLAEVAVAACVVLPWYLRELSKVGIGRRALAARLWLPLLVAAGVGGLAAAAARTIPVDLAALAAGGVVTLAATGLLAYLMRHSLAALRPHLSQRRPADQVSAGAYAAQPGRGEVAAQAGQAGQTGQAGHASQVGQVSQAGQVGQASHAGAAGRACGAVLTEPAAPSGHPAGPLAGLGARSPLPADSMAPLPAARDITGPLPSYRDSVLACPEPVRKLPVYQATVASLRWDPARDQRRATP